jgi:hypothetical protein
MAWARRARTLAARPEEHPMIHPALLHVPTPNWAALAWSMPYGWYEPPPPPDLSDLPPPGRYHLDPARSSVRAKVRGQRWSDWRRYTIAVGLRGTLERRASGFARRVALELTLVAAPEPVSFAPPCIAVAQPALRNRTAA